MNDLFQIPGIKGYLISRSGQVWSVRKQRVLTGKVANTGYKMIEYYKNGVRYRKNIHRILAEIFLDRVEGKNNVNHIDGNKLNNGLTNLEWCTHEENMKHAFRTGLCRNRCRGTNVRIKLSPEQINEILTSDKSQRHFAKKFGVSTMPIHRIRSGKYQVITHASV